MEIAIGAAPAAPSRSREGAWIEMQMAQSMGIGGMRRSREGAWIEIEIHPPLDCVLRSLPRGSVD